MQGIPVSDSEKKLHDMICALGCIACRQEGVFNPHVSVHHVYGRTRPGCHLLVLPLCEPHHQDNGTAIAVHPWKARWEKRYGKQDDLVAEQWNSLGVDYTHALEELRLRRRKKGSSSKPKRDLSARQDIKPEKKEQAKAKIPGRKLTSKADLSPRQQFTKTNKKKVSRKVVGKTPETSAFEDSQKTMRRERAAEARAANKKFQEQKRLEYEENNREKIEAQKALARDLKKKYREEAKKKMKVRSSG